MEILGYAGAVLIGLSLGLLGGGGSILAVPLFVYLFKVPASHATTYSLFVVGAASLFGFVKAFRDGRVNVRAGILFAIPSVVGLMLVRRLLLPMIPNEWNAFGIVWSKDTVILLSFAVVMLGAARAMLFPRKNNNPQGHSSPVKWILQAFLVGMVTGFVGAGGGFLIVPTLVAVFGLQMKEATGTSLGVIAGTSLWGFTGDLFAGASVDLQLLAMVTGLAAVGIALGTSVAHKVSDQHLKPAFGVFVLVIGTAIVLKQILL